MMFSAGSTSWSKRRTPSGSYGRATRGSCPKTRSSVRSNFSGRSCCRVTRDRSFWPGVGMDFNYSPADREFRAQFRQWLQRNLEYAVPALGPLADENEIGWDAALMWHRKLYEGSWLGITWPRQYGGR